jgi:hypothetical protein
VDNLQVTALYLLARLHFQVAIDDVNGKVLWGGEQGENAMLAEGRNNETLLINEAVSHDMTIVFLGGRLMVGG